MKRLAVLASLLLVTACTEDRYRWNLAHAWLNPRTPLPQRDFEKVVRLVSYATDEPIDAINVSRESNRLLADVSAGTTVSAHTFIVEKRGSVWYMVSKNEPEIE